MKKKKDSENTEKVKAFSYEFSGNELFYFLFKKKICPKCGGKMKQSKCAEIVDGSIYKSASVPLYVSGRRVKHYYCELPIT